eukprot:jgi/Chlat1/417/Chrsp10S01516
MAPASAAAAWLVLTLLGVAAAQAAAQPSVSAGLQALHARHSTDGDQQHLGATAAALSSHVRGNLVRFSAAAVEGCSAEDLATELVSLGGEHIISYGRVVSGWLPVKALGQVRKDNPAKLVCARSLQPQQPTRNMFRTHLTSNPLLLPAGQLQKPAPHTREYGHIQPAKQTRLPGDVRVAQVARQLEAPSQSGCDVGLVQQVAAFSFVLFVWTLASCAHVLRYWTVCNTAYRFGHVLGVRPLNVSEDDFSYVGRHHSLGGYYNDIAANALPKGVQVLSDYDQGTDEGRAMLQLVHAVAPNAKLAFYAVSSGEADFAHGIQALANAGCRVIVDDVLYRAEPMFQNGIIAQSVNRVRSRGVAYFSSSGNGAFLSYRADFVDSGVGGVIRGSKRHRFGVRGSQKITSQRFQFGPGVTIIALNW